jgi:DNA invertase Pin-like site-specific DNA recombinase
VLEIIALLLDRRQPVSEYLCLLGVLLLIALTLAPINSFKLVDALGILSWLTSDLFDGAVHFAQQRFKRSQALSHLLDRFVEFERSMIRQRINAGLRRAVEAGHRLGRPRIPADLEKRIQGLLRAKKGMLAIAKECRVGTGTVQRIAREMTKADRPFDGVNAAA